MLWRLFESSVGDGRDGINETLCLLEGLGGVDDATKITDAEVIIGAEGFA